MPLIETDTLATATDLGGMPAASLIVAEAGGQTILLAGGQFQDSGVARIEPTARGALSILEMTGTRAAPEDGRIITAPGLGVLEQGGRTFLYTAGIWTDTSIIERGYLVYELAADGGMTEVEEHHEDGLSTIHDDPKFAVLDDATYMVHLRQNRQLTSYEVGEDGTLAFSHVIDVKDAGNSSRELDVADMGKRTYVVTEGGYSDGPLQTYRIKDDGSFTRAFTLDRHDPGLDNKIVNDVHVGEVGKRTFVFVPENTGGSVAVYEMSPKGALTLVEIERPDTGDTWRFSDQVAFFEHEGRHFLAAGGSSVGIFEVSDRGALTEIDGSGYGAGGSRTYDLAAAEVGGEQLVFASTLAGPTVHAFRFVPGPAAGVGSDGGNDLIEGGGGRDKLFGEAGNDNIYGNGKSDRLDGGDGEDWVWGGGGKDRLFGGPSRDYLHGENGNDKAFGGDGDDYLFGDKGNDRLYGELGSDVLVDGKGRDAMTGGAFADTFVLVRDGAEDRITDFENGLDSIDIEAWGPKADFPDFDIAMDGDWVRLDWRNEVLLLQNEAGDLLPTDLDLGDFVFA